ncbi:menaquinone biosynthesis decarboxylase [Campylobacter sp. JMF_06 NA1]|uniref:menaquinone biosynthesis decarboxylase n=1 Tax=Campylobacter sp. JMF_06 NA1 TaxID=2983823 RepID=UPI0022E9E4F2|nr:menaquinone biosynthesis decarboxylase [Campylobacter sp. JMF_06 NA1]MDA3078379.1 menaquinone biosynthesis decarboxylase [Campylobacter sp. JMF_06 NA1]
MKSVENIENLITSNPWIHKLHKAGLLRIIAEPCDIDLEIAHISYIEVKKPNSQALLFLNPTNSAGAKFAPVLTNVFGSFEALNLILGREVEEIAGEIEALLKPKKPKNFKEKIDFLSYLVSLRKVFTKRKKVRGECQQVVHTGADVDLGSLPILKTWKNDGGAFITMGQVYTKDLNGDTQNLGMYRLQVYDKNHLGMHWQIHKDGAHLYHEYARAGRKMPVSVAIGGDPLYIWCGQAPLPKGVFELLLYGFIRKEPACLVKSITNDIYVPHDADFVIEGFVEPGEMCDEGPFGDHTGFYTPILPFPVMRVEAITHKTNPIFAATVVGKPPLEDKFMGYATERIFLPLFRTSAPDLIDYRMPENGVFHNLILAKFSSRYPAHAQQLMHAFWGVGQMSFVKHAIFVGEDAPNLGDYRALAKFILDRISPKSLTFSEGVCDQLDHASPNACFGGKLGIDVSQSSASPAPQVLSDEDLLESFHNIKKDVVSLAQHFTECKNPFVLVNLKKSSSVRETFELLCKEAGANFKILIFTDEKNDPNNLYMSLWRVVNNIDALRDVFINGEHIGIDATSKGAQDGYDRQWPGETLCSREVLETLVARGLIERDEEFWHKFEIV